jgi:diguanylate cyclase (GGDEF)-like protein
MRVLVVDDSQDALLIARARLADEGLEIHWAGGGTEGLEAAQRIKPDLVLLDIDMPDLSGYDVCRAMKGEPDLCMIPVIFLSGCDGLEDRVKGLDIGAVDYVTKPFDAFELRARVRAALRTKRLQDLLTERAHFDPLTELPNRRALDDDLQREWGRLQRHCGCFSLIMADVDRFKLVNDTCGHPAGDDVLRGVARAIAGQCREIDLAARYGGEEFAIVVPHEEASGAVHLAERCRVAVQDLSVRAAGHAIRVTASFGVADTLGAASIQALIVRSDANLYRAKQAGRNAVVCDLPHEVPSGTTQSPAAGGDAAGSV